MPGTRISVGRTEVVPEFMSGNGHAKGRDCLEVRKSIRMGRISADDTLPGHAIRIAEFLAGPQMRHIVLRRWRILVPVVSESVEHPGGAQAICAKRISGGPGVLIRDRERQADVSFIDRRNRIHDAEDVAVRRRRASQSIRVLQIRLSREFDNFERRKDCGGNRSRGIRHHLLGAGAHLLFQRITARARDVRPHIFSGVQQIISGCGGRRILLGRLNKV